MAGSSSWVPMRAPPTQRQAAAGTVLTHGTSSECRNSRDLGRIAGWKMLAHPCLPQRLLVRHDSVRLIAVEIETERHQHGATAIECAKGDNAWPRLVEPQQGVVRTLAGELDRATERRDTCR